MACRIWSSTCESTLVWLTRQARSVNTVREKRCVKSLGLRSAVRRAPAAHWGSWADCLHTISERHAHIDQTMTDALISPSAAAVHLTGGVRNRASLAECGFVCPEWAALMEGLQPNQPAAMRWIPPITVMVGSSSQLRESNTISAQNPCGHVWHRPSKDS